jgi:hypothetical protein
VFGHILADRGNRCLGVDPSTHQNIRLIQNTLEEAIASDFAVAIAIPIPTIFIIPVILTISIAISIGFFR